MIRNLSGKISYLMLRLERVNGICAAGAIGAELQRNSAYIPK